MKQSLLFVFCLAIGFGQTGKEETMSTFRLSSTAFNNGETIPAVYSCEGRDISPPLTWSGVPEGVKSFALICVDPDAPVGDWIHWIAWNIPATKTGLKDSIPADEQTELTQGMNSWRRTGYGGPCPPGGHGPHRYYFTLYALDVDRLDLDMNAQLGDLKEAMKGHLIGTATLMGRYERQ